LKKSEERVKKCQTEEKGAADFLEMENKYLRDIKELNDSFDEYKKQVERHIGQLTVDKQNLQKAQEEADQTI